MNTKKLVAIVLIVLFLVFFVPTFLLELVRPAEIGVKQNLWGGGVVAKDYDTGYHVGITGWHKWYPLDKKTHFVNFSEMDYRMDARNSRPALEIRTRDNNTATIDVTITYRIKPGEGHLIVAEGLKEIYRDRAMSTVEGVMREELAQLSSEDFYDPEARLNRVRETLPVLSERMSSLHVEPLDILIRAMRFPSGYEQKLQDKQLTLQKTLLFTAQELVENQLQVTGKMEKEIEAAEKETRGDWDKRLQELSSNNLVAIATVLAEAEVYDKGTRAEAQAQFEVDTADGKLAIDQAEALRNELRNRALDTLGGRIFLARQAAENLQIDSVTLNSNDPNVPTVIDVAALTKLLIGEQ